MRDPGLVLGQAFQRGVIPERATGRGAGGRGMKRVASETWCYEVLRRVRWPEGIACPLCLQRRVTVHSKSLRTPRRKYLCLACHRTFTDLSGTVFARSNLPLGKWFLGLSLLPQGLPTVELARVLGVKWDTARKVSRRLLVAASRPGLIKDLRAVLAGEGASFGFGLEGKELLSSGVFGMRKRLMPPQKSGT